MDVQCDVVGENLDGSSLFLSPLPQLCLSGLLKSVGARRSRTYVIVRLQPDDAM